MCGFPRIYQRSNARLSTHRAVRRAGRRKPAVCADVDGAAATPHAADAADGEARGLERLVGWVGGWVGRNTIARVCLLVVCGCTSQLGCPWASPCPPSSKTFPQAARADVAAPRCGTGWSQTRPRCQSACVEGNIKGAGAPAHLHDRQGAEVPQPQAVVLRGAEHEAVVVVVRGQAQHRLCRVPQLRCVCGCVWLGEHVCVHG